MNLYGENLAYSYCNGDPLFQGFDIVIHPGEIVGLHGYSGCGKTTLGKILAGYIQPDVGVVKLGEAPITARGFCPVQMIHQHPNTSIDPRWRLRQVLSSMRGNLAQTMEWFELDPAWLVRYPGEVSGGELQRFCVARAFDDRTRYLVADEITTMMDGLLQAKLWKRIVALAQERRIGLLVISHDHDLLAKLCDRVIQLSIPCQWSKAE
ncbi:hypothetical protein BSZ39_08585 [Bowdeniella nasicola]|uniref:ABC transporter domain-containing protein n=1 Tax=Bowdeniella nasicola TaxID=208480 RepID=A0A1Q5Q199_9ACTO|nr:ATP-binding cassette domain-containing protein [Bowdeniella nasicola]OKL53601.1 hypothetical protein BSZ39_08585 [Bowdeniella nasicola]